MKQIILSILILCTLGCSTFRQTAIDVSEEEMQNAETARIVAANYLTIWPIQSGFIRGVLGSRMDELPAQAVAAMDELDQIVAENQDYSDYDLGLSLGLRVRLLVSVVHEALEMYFPDIIEYVPLLF